MSMVDEEELALGVPQTWGNAREAVIAGRWGWLPALSLVLASGMALAAIAFQGAVAGAGWAENLFWLSILLLIMPVTARLVSLQATRRERIGLVLLLGLSLYLVKVMHSPFTFTFSDELVHAFNVDQILRTHHLFGGNAILPVTPFYPGLEAVTAALTTLSGLSAYTAGLIIIGAGRLIITLALYLFYEKLSRSQRLAGLATVFYMANSNYLFWSAQFSYESLALPLATLVLFALLYRQETGNAKVVRGATAVLLLLILAITVTHHLTSYALVTALFLVAALYSMLRVWNLGRVPNVWGLALTALAAVVFWLTFFAKGTFDYILPVFHGAVLSSLKLIFGFEPGRTLFTTQSGVTSSTWEQVVAIGSVLLILFGIPLGLLQLWRRYRRAAFALLLALAALAYFPIQGMRLTGAGWETANRASEFLFIGIAFVIALGAVTFWVAKPNLWNTLATSLLVGVLFLGAVIAGWPPALRLPKPYQVSVETAKGKQTLVDPQSLAAARWAKAYLGAGNRIATDNSDALVMQRYGLQYPLSGSKYGVRDLFFSGQVGSGEMEILQVTQVRYLVFARSPFYWDRMLGLYFDPNWGLSAQQVEQAKFPNNAKFDAQAAASRILDTGNIVIYDVGGLSHVATK